MDGWGMGMFPPAMMMKGFFGKGFDKGKGKGKGDKGDGKGKGKVAAKIAAGETIYHGAIKNYNAEKSHGYVVCEEIFQICGQDVYAFKDVLERGGAGPGDNVAFFIHWSPKGQPQASSPLIRLAAETGFALKGMYKRPNAEGQGFGFIDCNETKEFFGRDVYVNADIASQLQAGQSVCFNVFLNRDGMPNVQSLEACNESWQPTPNDLSHTRQSANVESAAGAAGKSSGKGGGKGGKGAKSGLNASWGGEGGGWDASWGSPWDAMGPWGMDMSAWAWGGTDVLGGWGCGGKKGGGKKGCGGGKKGGGGAGAGPMKQPEPTGKCYTGMVKSFNAMNNYGFIACEEVKHQFGHDVFIHGAALDGHEVGEMVTFELALNTKGQPQAINLKPLSGGEEPAAKKPRTSPSMQAMSEIWGQMQQQHSPEDYPQAGNEYGNDFASNAWAEAAAAAAAVGF